MINAAMTYAPSEPTIRKMTVDDFNTVYALEQMCFQEHAWHEHELYSQYHGPYAFNLVGAIAAPQFSRGHLVVGYLLAAQCSDGLLIENLGVAPAYRRRGIGSALVQCLIETLRADKRLVVVSGRFSGQRSPRIVTDVRETNGEAVRFFRSQAFLATALIPRAYDRIPDDAYRFEHIVHAPQPGFAGRGAS